MTINTGGPAFPTSKSVGSASITEGGLTLRDYFAAKALGEAFRFRQTASGGSGGSFEYAAKIAYQIADAMIAAREATHGD